MARAPFPDPRYARWFVHIAEGDLRAVAVLYARRSLIVKCDESAAAHAAYVALQDWFDQTHRLDAPEDAVEAGEALVLPSLGWRALGRSVFVSVVSSRWGGSECSDMLLFGAAAQVWPLPPGWRELYAQALGLRVRAPRAPRDESRAFEPVRDGFYVCGRSVAGERVERFISPADGSPVPLHRRRRGFSGAH